MYGVFLFDPELRGADIDALRLTRTTDVNSTVAEEGWVHKYLITRIPFLDPPATQNTCPRWRKGVFPLSGDDT